MPTYEYKCDNCGYDFDEYQSMKDAKLTKCPKCGKDALKRLIGTGGGLIFKGTGFYLTDYKNKPSGKSSASENKKDVVTDKTSESNSETSPENSEKKTTEKQSAPKAEKKEEKK